MESDSDTSDTNLVIITKRDRAKLFCKLYWRSLAMIFIPILFLPIACLGDAYVVLFVFLTSCCYWLLDLLHPAVIALLPVAIFSLIDFTYYKNFISELHLNGVFNCLGALLIIIAVEYSGVHRRAALKLLLVVGCSHYRISFLLFFTSMFLSMWVSNTLACSVLIPLTSGVLFELEWLGIIEVYHNIGKHRQSKKRHEEKTPRPTDFTIFYFLGIAYSSTIGGMAALVGSQSNLLFKHLSKMIFPVAPKITFPDFVLLTLPGVLLMQTLLYLWLNFRFMGMFSNKPPRNQMSLENGLSDEELEYIKTLLVRQYSQLGKIRFQEILVSVLIALTMLLQATRSQMSITYWSPIGLCVFLFFVLPVDLNFVKFFMKRSNSSEEPFPMKQSNACLNWALVNKKMPWSVLFVIAGSCIMMETLRTSGAPVMLLRMLRSTRDWPAPAQAFIVILLCKTLTEFAPNACVLYAILPSIAKLGVESRVNPLYLISAASLSCALPFHLIPGAAANAIVQQYANIPPWKMMQAGIGPTLSSIGIIWITCTLWARVIWPDFNTYPPWAESNIFDLFLRENVPIEVRSRDSFLPLLHSPSGANDTAASPLYLYL